jgi:chemotaxis protein histidine kinase CheA
MSVSVSVLSIVSKCGEEYNFDVESALLMLSKCGLYSESSSSSEEKSLKKVKVGFPMPFSGMKNEKWCNALCKNEGLYTQCESLKEKESSYCKSCNTKMRKLSSNVPAYGTIEERMSQGLLEYTDPSGNKVVPYVKIMKKHKLTVEMVMEEAEKQGIRINEVHLEDGSKKKEAKPEGKKGRPKKSKKVAEIEDEEESANVEDDVLESLVEDVLESLEAPKEDPKEAKEAAKAAKEAEKAAAKAAKEAEKEAAKAAKEAEKEAAKAAKEAAKEAAKAAKEAEKAAKEAEKATKEAAKGAKKASSKETKEETKSEATEEEEEEIVKKIKFEGKYYLKSQKSGIIYDYNAHVNCNEQVVVGVWNESDKTINFNKDDNESSDESGEEEDEYEA